MENPSTGTINVPVHSLPPPIPQGGDRLSSLRNLLDSSDHVLMPTPRVQAATQGQNQLIQVRLGLASGLFHALRAKHAPTAAHCLRVAINASLWATARATPPSHLDELEIAALLHDVGKIGVPDPILQKPGKLIGEEIVMMERQRHFAQAILRSCCASQAVLDIVAYAGAWFDGTRDGYDRSGAALPLGARMLNIVDAFDSMTTDHPYRRALSRERAIAELFEFAGRQFDPELVQDFCRHFSSDPGRLQAGVVERWLHPLAEQTRSEMWLNMGHGGHSRGELDLSQCYHAKLLESMHDGVAYVDVRGQILLWNRACERLTGISAAAVQQRTWNPTLVGLKDNSCQPVAAEDDPVAIAIHTGTQVLRRMSVAGRNGKPVAVNLHATPVLGDDGVVRGATLLLHDATSQNTLEERVQTLYERATQDPLTKVANRAEFNRLHELFVEEHLQHGLTCALIICDLDHFKKINDTYGHPAGDAALISFASLLQRNCRQGDLVARYGGEEFVMLCADCDNGTATSRADEIRRQLAATAQPAINGNRITASFGVTELQAGDTAETMLRRADRALLQAKGRGRNTVVQLGTGMTHDPANESQSRNWLWRLTKSPEHHSVKRTLSSAMPLNVTVEKLRGFIADHKAQLISVDNNLVVMLVEGNQAQRSKRSNDRPVPFFAEISLEEQTERAERTGVLGSRTIMRVTIRPKRHRDRRLKDIEDRMVRLVMSIRSYLMANEVNDPEPTPQGSEVATEPEGFFSRCQAVWCHWIGSDH